MYLEDNRLLKKIKYIIPFFITFAVLLIVMIGVGVEPFGEKSILIGDSYDQYLAFFSVLRSKLLSNDIGVHNFSYSWEVGLGANFLLLFFYYLASPFNILVLFVSKSGLSGLLTIIIMLKASLSAASFSYYLSHKKVYSYSFIINIVFSIAYGLSGYFCGFYWNVMWLDSLIVLPIVIIGLNRFLDGGKPIVYIISLCIAIYLNFYTAFMICIFLTIYFLLYKHSSFKSFITTGVKFVFCSFLAAGMTAISLLVTYFGIGHTMTANYESPRFGFFGNVFYSLRQAFFLTKPVTVDNTRFNGFSNIYCGVFVILLLFIYLFSSKISFIDKMRKVGILLILFISMNERVLNYIWHGFHEQFLIPNRFSFLFIFILLDLCYEAFDSIYDISIKRLVTAGVLAIIYPIICFVFVDFDGFISSASVVLINVLLLATYFIIVLLINRFEKNVLLVPFFVILLLEICVNTFYSFNCQSISKDISKLISLDDYISESNDNLLYREELFDPVLTNGSSFVGLKGASVFCSTISGDSHATMMDLGYRGLTNQYEFMGYTPFSLSLLGIKNVYYIDEYGKVSIYENPSSLPIGFQVNEKVLDYSPDQENDAARNMNSFASLATDSDMSIFLDVSSDVEKTVYNADIKESIDMNNSVYLSKTGESDPVLQLDYTISTAGTYYLYMRATNYDNLTVVVNDNLYAQGAIFNGMLEISDLDIGDHLTIYFETTEDTPVIWYLNKYDEEVASSYIQSLSVDGINVTDFNEGDFSFDINLEQSKMLMLTIPYDRGWKVYENDNIIETVPVFRGFTGVRLSEGNHSIRMVYTPEGFYSGLVLTLISWMVFIGYILYSKRRSSVDESISEE